MNETTGIPAWTNPQGHHVPDSLVWPPDKLRHAPVRNAVNEAREFQRRMRDFMATWQSEAQAFVELAVAEYQTTVGSVKGNLTLRTFDGLMEMTVQVADRLTFDERLKVAEALVGECLAKWSADARPELKAIVERAFKTDKEGNVSTGAVLELRRMNIADERWRRAMDAISDALQCTGTATHLRFYERSSMGGPLDGHLPRPGQSRESGKPMKTIHLDGDHGLGLFRVKAVIVGKLCVHRQLNGDHFHIAHKASLYRLPGVFATEDAALSAAKELDTLADWDAVAAALKPPDGGPGQRPVVSTLGLYAQVIKTVAAHNGRLSDPEMAPLLPHAKTVTVH